MNKIYVAKSKDFGNDQWKINFMNELIEVIHQTAENLIVLKQLMIYYGF